MKKAIILSILISLFIRENTYSQREKIINLPNEEKKTLNFGFYLGMISSNYDIEYKESIYSETQVVVEGGYGFKLGVIGEWKLNKNLSIRLEPGIASNVNKLYFNNRALLTERDSVREVPKTYLHIPLMVKFATNRLNNIRPFVIGGVSYDLNFSSNQDNPEDNLSGEFRMTKHNFMYEIGVGMDFYMDWFKFSPSIIGVFAINNELHPDNNDATSPYTGPIKSMKSSGIFLKLVFD